MIQIDIKVYNLIGGFKNPIYRYTNQAHLFDRRCIKYQD